MGKPVNRIASPSRTPLGVAQASGGSGAPLDAQQREVVRGIGPRDASRAAAAPRAPDLRSAPSIVSSLSASSVAGTTWALVTMVVPSPTAKPVPRKRKAGERVLLERPDRHDRALTRCDRLRRVGQGLGRGAAAAARERQPPARTPRAWRVDIRVAQRRRARSARGQFGEGSVTVASYGCSFAPESRADPLHVGARLGVRRDAAVAVDRALAGVVGRGDQRRRARGNRRAASAGTRGRRARSAPDRTAS